MRKSKGKERVRVSMVERRRRKRKEEASGTIRSLEASFYTQKVGILVKFPKYPFNKLQDITFFPPYKNSSSNFTTKKRDNKSMKKVRVGLSHLCLYLPSTIFRRMVTPQHFHHRDILSSKLSNLAIYNCHKIVFI